MEHLAALMLLVGCSADAVVCRELPVPIPMYGDAAECLRDLGLQMRLADADRVYGVCGETDGATIAQATAVDWQITRSGRLTVSFRTEPQVLVSR